MILLDHHMQRLPTALIITFNNNNPLTGLCAPAIPLSLFSQLPLSGLEGEVLRLDVGSTPGLHL